MAWCCQVVHAPGENLYELLRCSLRRSRMPSLRVPNTSKGREILAVRDQGIMNWTNVRKAGPELSYACASSTHSLLKFKKCVRPSREVLRSEAQMLFIHPTNGRV